MSIPEFRNACHEFAQNFVDIQMSQFKRLGVVGDWEHPYLAMNPSFEAREVKVFADPENYPILMHCSAGRDRTGCLSFVLQALCGASREDIIRDYELSFLSVNGCSDDAGTVVFMNAQLDRTLNYIEEIGGGDTFAESVENFLLEIGVTEEEIASIREILIEDVE
jgi:hypothetical protein